MAILLWLAVRLVMTFVVSQAMATLSAVKLFNYTHSLYAVPKQTHRYYQDRLMESFFARLSDEMSSLHLQEAAEFSTRHFSHQIPRTPFATWKEGSQWQTELILYIFL